MPNSNVRREIEYASTPYTPASASSSASPANVASNAIVKRRVAIEAVTISSSVRMSDTGRLRSMLPTIARTAGTEFSGSPLVWMTS